MNGTSNSSSSGFSFGDATLRRHSKEGNMVVLDDDGLSVVLIPAQAYLSLCHLGAKKPLQSLDYATPPSHIVHCLPCVTRA